MEQTAVEWLFDKIFTSSQEDLYNAFEQAKEMEKQQIIDAYDVKWVEYIINGKDYYKETFKNK